jgi:hypothetical protein
MLAVKPKRLAGFHNWFQRGECPVEIEGKVTKAKQIYFGPALNPFGDKPWVRLV